MKKRAVVLTGIILVAIVVLFGAFLFEVDVRWPWGPSGDVQVHYTIPVTMPDEKEGYNSFTFSVAGHVERVQLVPTSGHNAYGFVMLYIKTSEGWYETPTASLGGPVDWKRGVTVEFTYPEDMKPRKQTAYVLRAIYPAFGGGGLRWRKTIPPLEYFLAKGDIASILFCHQEDGIAVTVQRTTGGRHQAHGGGDSPSDVGVEVMMSGK